MLSTLNKINYFYTARHFDSYDFSTLYTSIPHVALKEALGTLVREAYKIRDSEYIVAGTNGNAYWSNVPSSSSLKQSISEQVLVNYMEYLIDNNIGSRIYRQCIGIPMGTDCAPLVANLFLFYYEYKYMQNMVKTNLMLAIRFSNTIRYIDDLLTLNNTSFHSAIDDIYPEELKLKTKHPSHLSHCHSWTYK